MLRDERSCSACRYPLLIANRYQLPGDAGHLAPRPRHTDKLGPVDRKPRPIRVAAALRNHFTASAKSWRTLAPLKYASPRLSSPAAEPDSAAFRYHFTASLPLLDEADVFAGTRPVSYIYPTLFCAGANPSEAARRNHFMACSSLCATPCLEIQAAQTVLGRRMSVVGSLAIPIGSLRRNPA